LHFDTWYQEYLPSLFELGSSEPNAKGVPMTRLMGVVTVAALLVQANGVPAEESAEGYVYEPKDGKSFSVTHKDIVRFTGPAPGSTGIKTTATIKEGPAKLVERKTFSVRNGKVVAIGGRAMEFDVIPVPGKTGTVRVTVTTTAPGKQAVTKEYEFEVISTAM
jgi:hypothetical protein